MADDPNDPFWEAFAEAAQEDIEQEQVQDLDPRWSAYAAGELSHAEAEELLQRAGQSREGQLAAALFKPVDDGVASSIVEHIRSRRASDSQSEPTRGHTGTLRSSGQGSPEASDRGEPRETPAETDDAPPGISRWLRRFFSVQHSGFHWAAGMVALLILSVGLFFFVGDGVLPSRTEPALPDFTPSLRASSDLRSGDTGEQELFHADGRLELRLQPETTVSGQAVLSVFIRDESGEIRRWSAAEKAAHRHEAGTFSARALEWPWGPGEFTLFFIVGRDSLEALELGHGQTAEQALGPDFSVARYPLRMEPAEPAPP